ncbi:MAG TPA: hypothetical protein PKC79_10960 [Solidesulfovibrio magneticus]|nr:hypothetical protein [Solidesulfovibrio magneticus]
MKYTIFYSWQSDLPNNTNRRFIEDVINRAAKDVNSSDEYEVYIILDRDTQGVPGSPNISQTILEKIKKSDAFVADISIVTGGKESGGRPSPNPNVLLELGYAIALLGWERIVLFCNDIYGVDDDLPFDIRQHRRINYSLRQEDEKQQTRQRLSSVFKQALIEFINHGRRSVVRREPDLQVSWASLEIASRKAKLERSEFVVVPRLPTVEQVNEELNREIESVRGINGEVDSEWENKVKKYIHAMEEFRSKIQNKSVFQGYVAGLQEYRSRGVSLMLRNEGRASASDVRVEIEVPSWLLALEKKTSSGNVLAKPKQPKLVPTIPKRQSLYSSLVSGVVTSSISYPMMDNYVDVARNYSDINRASRCFVSGDGQKIVFRAQRLLHKHELKIDEDVFYLAAISSASIGAVEIKADVFCSEYEDWREVNLRLEIV